MALPKLTVYTAAMLRYLLSLLLCACLALQGGTVALAAEAPCPMQAEMQSMLQAGDLDAADLPDCCNDLQTWAETGKPCKTGADCQVVVAWALVPSVQSVAVAAASEVPVLLSAAAPAAPPGMPWRPPSAI